MKPIIRLPATGPIIGWNRIHIDQYVEYLDYPPSIKLHRSWRPVTVTLRNKPTTITTI